MNTSTRLVPKPSPIEKITTSKTFRAFLNLAPNVGSSIDVLLTGEPNYLTLKRLEDLYDSLDRKFDDLSTKSFIRDEHFIEIRKQLISVNCKSSSEEKRTFIQDLLITIIETEDINDYSTMFAYDLEVLQKQHIFILKQIAPNVEAISFKQEKEMSEIIGKGKYNKVINDLLRIGLLEITTISGNDMRYNSDKFPNESRLSKTEYFDEIMNYLKNERI